MTKIPLMFWKINYWGAREEIKTESTIIIEPLLSTNKVHQIMNRYHDHKNKSYTFPRSWSNTGKLSQRKALTDTVISAPKLRSSDIHVVSQVLNKTISVPFRAKQVLKLSILECLRINDFATNHGGSRDFLSTDPLYNLSDFLHTTANWARVILLQNIW